MKKILIAYISFFSLLFGEIEPMEKMRELIVEIASRDSEKLIILQNGSEIYYDDGVLNEEFLQYIDGAGQESFLFGSGGVVDKKTPKEDREYLLNNLVPLEEKGKKILTINYSKNRKNRKEIEKINKKYGFVGESIKDFSADSFNLPIKEFNLDEVRSLDEVKNFLYLLNPSKFNSKDEYLRALKSSEYDLLIIEPTLNGSFFTKDEIEQLKYKKNGSRRLVIAYFSIGEAEDYRYYWEKSWSKKLPDWIVEENENWEGNYIVKYWSKEWQEIVKEYQRRLESIGVDGYYLDTIDSFQYFEDFLF
jgi:cysteinyl-tRNA synthetase